MDAPSLAIEDWKQEVAEGNTQLGFKKWGVLRTIKARQEAIDKTIEEKWRCRYDDCDGLLEVNYDHCRECGRKEVPK